MSVVTRHMAHISSRCLALINILCWKFTTFVSL